MSEADRARAIDEPTLSAVVRSTLLEALCASTSDLVILPIQDVFGWRDSHQPARDRRRPELDMEAPLAGPIACWSNPRRLRWQHQLRDCAARHGR